MNNHQSSEAADELNSKTCALKGCINVGMVNHLGITICTMHDTLLSEKREAAFKARIAANNQQLIEKFEAIIGKSEVVQSDKINALRSIPRNQLRKQQREQLAKLKGEVSS